MQLQLPRETNAKTTFESHLTPRMMTAKKEKTPELLPLQISTT
jgi:hypothetical protein